MPNTTGIPLSLGLHSSSYTEELAELFLDMFSPAEAIEWFEANESDRPVVIRTNTLKTKRKDLAQVRTSLPLYDVL